MTILESLDKTANELASNIKILSDRLKVLGEKGQDTSTTSDMLIGTCNELGRINDEIKSITNKL